MNDSVTSYKFGIKFEPVRLIPEDPRQRLPYFKTFKSLIAQEKLRIQAWHQSGVGGREVIQAHTSLIDEVIRHLIAALAALPRYRGAAVLDSFALVAVGGYGRGELNPYSDIDLLFLTSPKIKKSTDEFIQDLISIFWGIGMEIGHSCRTVKECIKLAHEDVTIKTSLIETRFLTGKREKYDRFCDSYARNVLKKNIRSFLDFKQEEKVRRYGETEEMVCVQEPNVKDGPGGLRDYHTAMWAAAVRFGSLSLREIGENEMISGGEVDALYESVNFLLRVRNELHYQAKKKHDVLTLDLQKRVAASLGYPSENETVCVESFMRDYFLHATNIHKFSKTIFDLCRHSKRGLKTVLSAFTQKQLADGFVAKDGALILGQDAERFFSADRTQLLKLFDLCREHGVEPNYQLKRQIRLNKHLLDAQFLRDPWVKTFLFSILENPQSVKSLRLMHDTEVLGQILPEFGRVHCRVSYDFYHRFTADEHSLRMVFFLEELVQDTGELGQLYTELPAQGLLKLAALLQSVGRQEGAQASSDRTALKTVAERLKLESGELETLEFLVQQQSAMVEAALYQDIRQPATVRDFAGRTGTRERLDLLYLITYADLRAVAPGTWTSWKKVLLSELYHRTADYLERPESLKEIPQATREEVYKALNWEFTAAEIETHLNQLPKDYLIASQPQEVALHLRLIRSLRNRTFILHHQFNEGGDYHNLTLCCMAKLEAFKKLVGTVTSKNLNILGAQIYLKKDGIVILSIQVATPKNSLPHDIKIWKEVKETLEEVLKERITLPALLASRTRYVKPRPASHAIVPKIRIENAASQPYTLLRIEARDHLGMLYKIAKVIADFGIQIHRAKIATQGDRGIDVFFISLKNKKLVFPKLIRRIKERLVHVLLMEKVEEID